MKKKNGEVKKIMAEIVATTSLPVDRLTATDCNAAARAKSPDMSVRYDLGTVFAMSEGVQRSQRIC